MPATVIGVTGLNEGFVGNITHSDFPLRTPRTINPTDTLNVAFGETLVLNLNNTYSSVAQYLKNGTGPLAGSLPIALAVANSKTNPSFPLAGNNGVYMPAGVYVPGNVADALVIGSMDVNCNIGTPTGAGGPVYMRTAANTAQSAGIVGGLEATQPDTAVSTTATWTSGGNTIAVTSATGVAVGQIVAGAGIPAGTFVKSISGTTVTLSQNTTAAGTAAAVVFTYSVLMPNLQWKTGISLTSNGVYSVTILTRQIP
jgi:hypothetical protein